jgi:valyl-tRNA synthetase
LSVSDAQQFFLKKKQTLSQVGASKLCNYLFSRQEKGIKGTKKYLSAYFGGFVSYERDEPAFSRFLQEIFREAWKADKILVRKNIAYRSIDLQTTVPAHQILFEQVKGENYTIKYFVETKNDFLPTCARIPDMIFGDVALLVHPQDKRYKKLI